MTFEAAVRWYCMNFPVQATRWAAEGMAKRALAEAELDGDAQAIHRFEQDLAAIERGEVPPSMKP